MMFAALFISLCISCVLSVLWISAMDRADALERARRGEPQMVTPSLPRAIAIPTAYRKGRP